MKRDVPLALIVFALGLWQNLSDLRVTPFHPDETRWLHRAAFVGELKDPLGPYWDDGYMMRVQPPLGSYLMGIGLLAQGRDLDTNGAWDFNYGRLYNIAHGNMASQADLDAGRRTNSVVGALTLMVVFFLAKHLTNRIGGVVAALFLAAHPLMIYHSSQAISDALLTFLVASAALLAIVLAERPTWSRVVLLGVVLGLGTATKLSPMLVALGLAGIGLVLISRGLLRWRYGEMGAVADIRLGRMLAVLPVFAFATFVAVFPYLWSDPIAGTRAIVEFRAQEMESQGSIWQGLAVESQSEAFRRVGITLGDRFTTTGRFAAKLAHGAGFAWHPSGIDLPLALIGLELLIVLAVSRGLRSGSFLALAVLGGQAAAILLGMRADFARYHLPILLLVAVCAGVLSGQVWSFVSRPAVVRLVRDRSYALLDRIVPSTIPEPAAPVPAPSRLARPRRIINRRHAARPQPLNPTIGVAGSDGASTT